MKNRSNIEATMFYKDMYDYLKARNCKHKLNIMDNEASTAVNSYITNENVNYQLAEPNHHRVSVPEHAIGTFRNHFVAGLSSVPQNFLCIYGMN